MNFHVLTLFPEMIEQGVNTSITGRAINNGLLSINAVNIRDYAFNKHNSVDDYPYGGGAGMLMQAEPVYLAYEAVKEQIDKRKQENIKSEEVTSTEPADCSEVRNSDLQDENSKKRPLRVVYLSPQGDVFNQKMAEEMAQEEDLVLLCGHYEGIDERVLEEIVTDYVSIGDYVLTGGELPAMVMIDTISRLVPGVLHNDVSAEFESFQDNLLEYPQYSRPEEWRGKKVPPILLSGHHANIEKWRREQSILRTMERRPDLLKESNLTDKEKLTLRDLRIVQEMYARGYEFMPIDIYRAHATDFQVIDGKIMPSFASIDGMGEKAAIGLMEEAKKGKFLSREDLCQRSKVSKTLADQMADMGLLGDMPKSNQISLFDIDCL